MKTLSRVSLRYDLLIYKRNSRKDIKIIINLLKCPIKIKIYEERVVTVYPGMTGCLNYFNEER